MNDIALEDFIRNYGNMEFPNEPTAIRKDSEEICILVKNDKDLARLIIPESHLQSAFAPKIEDENDTFDFLNHTKCSLK